jgi:hypothetical protein
MLYDIVVSGALARKLVRIADANFAARWDICNSGRDTTHPKSRQKLGS